MMTIQSRDDYGDALMDAKALFDEFLRLNADRMTRTEILIEWERWLTRYDQQLRIWGHWWTGAIIE